MADAPYPDEGSSTAPRQRAVPFPDRVLALGGAAGSIAGPVAEVVAVWTG